MAVPLDQRVSEGGRAAASGRLHALRGRIKCTGKDLARHGLAAATAGSDPRAGLQILEAAHALSGGFLEVAVSYGVTDTDVHGK